MSPEFASQRRCRCSCHDGFGIVPAGHLGACCCAHRIRAGQPCSQCDESLPTYVHPKQEPRPWPCRTCAGTRWICDVHQRGDCAECRSFDGSLSGCPTCTPPGGCGGTGTAEEVSGDDE